MSRYTRKAQMEIMGLAIIIVLLFLGMVFVIKFIVLKEPKEYKKEYTSTELASNIIGAMLYTTAEECSRVTFAKLFQDCAASGGAGGTIDCNGEYSCNYAESNVDQILKDTLGTLNLQYHFKVQAGNDEIIKITSDKIPDTGCPSSQKQKRYPLPGVQTIFVILNICG